jgi:hypothetical protein
MSLEDGVFAMPVDDTVKEGEVAATKAPDSSGAGAKWFVKGGSFAFRVSSVFAIGSAYIETEESAVGGLLLRKQDKTLMRKVTPDSSVGSIYSMPMDVSTPIASDIYIGITSDGGEEINISVDWKTSFVTKPMPQAIWSNPNNPPDRLSADKGTVNHQMAVSFTAPPPILAKAKVPQFKASDMAKSCAGTNVLPTPEPVQTTFLPAVTVDTTSNRPKAWTDFQGTWNTCAKANQQKANAMVAACMSTLGWDKPPPDVAVKIPSSNPHPWAFDASFPTRLVNGTGDKDDDVRDGFSNFYLELPRATAV